LITIKNLWKSYNGVPVLKGLDLHVPAQKITIILGQSGVGKSVLLRQIAQLETPEEGVITIGGEELHPNISLPHVGMLFQSSALFDSMTIHENIAFALHQHRENHSESDVHEIVRESLEKVDLAGYQKKYPSELSGGQKRRAALARLIAYKPKILLFDEPTTGLDPITAAHIAKLIRETQKSLQATAVVVTHDIISALSIGDFFALHRDGRIALSGDKNTFFSYNDEMIRQFVNKIPLF
jgi:phospholipid/cholesterol/gamma-HCH transport system ATP-binding protein